MRCIKYRDWEVHKGEQEMQGSGEQDVLGREKVEKLLLGKGLGREELKGVEIKYK